jgi:hypothetical protein
MVHPLTLKEYQEVSYRYVDNAHDKAEKDFNNWCKLSGRAPKITVNHITRVKVTSAEVGQPEEFLTWGETRVGFDHVGNEKTFTEDRMGSYIYPVFNKTWATETNTIIATSITKKETKYDTPFTPEKLAELYSMADKVNCKFYVKSGGNRYTIRYYNDFLSGSYEDLVELGQSKFNTLQELLNTRQQMIPASTVDKLVESKDRETRGRGRKED